MEIDRAKFERNTKADNIDFWEQDYFDDLNQRRILEDHPEFQYDQKKMEELRDERIIYLISIQQQGSAEMQVWANTMIWKESVGFIKWFAKNKYNVSYATSGSDLYNNTIQNLYVHLFEIVSGFDPQRASYSTYLRQWLAKYISEDLSKAKYKTENVYVATLLQKVDKAVHELERKNIPVTVATVSEMTKLELQRVENLMYILQRLVPVASYDLYEENLELDIPADYGNPEDSLIEIDRKESVSKALNTLTDIERLIIRKRYDLEEYGEEQSIAEIAKMLGKSSESVRRTMHRALKKMKRSIHLEGYGPGGDRKKERFTHSEEYAKFWQDEESPVQGYAISETDEEETYFE